ncbi:hypothetical protein [Xanthocytophaga flava]|uniref:hypothetical protein n=1 Tax=Xanthocytophaga flava TaxID=3048013 RepID=UPI0028D20017|nr:hypothetical protein [Xanthocytophaga flavus]MDJ1470179.1 hypothetical protein [Xanthocytophaga flavus]
MKYGMYVIRKTGMTPEEIEKIKCIVKSVQEINNLSVSSTYKRQQMAENFLRRLDNEEFSTVKSALEALNEIL